MCLCHPHDSRMVAPAPCTGTCYRTKAMRRVRCRTPGPSGTMNSSCAKVEAGPATFMAAWTNTGAEQRRHPPDGQGRGQGPQGGQRQRSEVPCGGRTVSFHEHPGQQEQPLLRPKQRAEHRRLAGHWRRRRPGRGTGHCSLLIGRVTTGRRTSSQVTTTVETRRW